MELKVKLTKKQLEVYNYFISGNYSEILVGGGGSGGKSYGIASIVTISCLQYAGIVWLVGRDSLKKLKTSTRLTFIKLWKSLGLKEGKDGDCNYYVNMQDFTVEFKNGSKIFFVDLGWYPSDPFYDRIGSMELTYSWIEEGQEVESIVSDTLSGRYRQKVKEYNLNPCTIITCNPKKGYLYDRFLSNCLPHRKFIQILYKDNPYLDQEKYKQGILNTGNKIQIERLLHGNWEYDETPGKLYSYDGLINLWNNPICNGKRYISIDGATEGEDLAVMMVWDGFEVKEMFVWEKSTTIDISNKAIDMCRKYDIPIQNIVNDHVGVGAGISYELGSIYQYSSNSSPIVSKGEPKPFATLRDQCFFEIQKHINKIKLPQTQYKEKIIEELDVMCQINIDNDGPLKVIKKDEIKKTIGRSPGFSDCISMRMVFELKKENFFFII